MRIFRCDSLLRQTGHGIFAPAPVVQIVPMSLAKPKLRQQWLTQFEVSSPLHKSRREQTPHAGLIRPSMVTMFTKRLSSNDLRGRNVPARSEQIYKITQCIANFYTPPDQWLATPSLMLGEGVTYLTCSGLSVLYP